MTAPDKSYKNRLELTRTLSKVAGESIQDILDKPRNSALPGRSRRIGITGPPGTGKSTLIAGLADFRLKIGKTVGVLAIDPSSPLTQGSILGDRIRMESVINNERFYLRSIPDTLNSNGLCHNIVNLLDVFEQYSFDDVVLETVGTGQSEHHVRYLVDTVVLVLNPQSGDIIQAMKAGIMEIADVFVINKTDLGGSELLERDIKGVLDFTAHEHSWRPGIIKISCKYGTGIQELNQCIDNHYEWVKENVAPDEIYSRRQDFQLAQLISGQVCHYLTENAEASKNLREKYNDVIRWIVGLK